MEFKEIPEKYKQEAQKQGRIVKIYQKAYKNTPASTGWGWIVQSPSLIKILKIIIAISEIS